MNAPNPFDAGRPRPVATVLDSLRARIDPERYDSIVLWLEVVAADLGYGDVRPLPGSVAWIDEQRAGGKQIALAASGERAASAVALAGVEDRFVALLDGQRTAATVERAIGELGGDAETSVLVDVSSAGIAAGRAAGVHLTIGVARDMSLPEELREAGADVVVADLQELLGPARFAPDSPDR